LSSYDQQAADKANARGRLRRRAAPGIRRVALTGSGVGRREGKVLYETAKVVAASRIRLSEVDDPELSPFGLIYTLGDKELEAAIDAYKVL
jgi:hypothetical protein